MEAWQEYGGMVGDFYDLTSWEIRATGINAIAALESAFV